jgi:hypothetical protein
MSALEALVLAGKGLNAFSVLFKTIFEIVGFELRLSGPLCHRGLLDNLGRPIYLYIFYIPKRLFNILRLNKSRLYSKVWPMLSIFDSNKQKTAVGN